jgi:hypothetical protein
MQASLSGTVGVKFIVRCRSCHRIVLDIVRIGDRESDALLSHLKTCRPDLVKAGEAGWRPELGSLLEQFDVTRA